MWTLEMKRTSGMSCACHVSSTWLSLMPFISTYCADHAPYLFFSTPNEKLLGRLVKEKVCANLVLTQPASSHNLRPPPVSFPFCFRPHSKSASSLIPSLPSVLFQNQISRPLIPKPPPVSFSNFHYLLSEYLMLGPHPLRRGRVC